VLHSVIVCLYQSSVIPYVFIWIIILQESRESSKKVSLVSEKWSKEESAKQTIKEETLVLLNRRDEVISQSVPALTCDWTFDEALHPPTSKKETGKVDVLEPAFHFLCTPLCGV
jgi:hypothetical protein